MCQQRKLVASCLLVKVLIYFYDKTASGGPILFLKHFSLEVREGVGNVYRIFTTTVGSLNTNKITPQAGSSGTSNVYFVRVPRSSVANGGGG